MKKRRWLRWLLLTVLTLTAGALFQWGREPMQPVRTTSGPQLDAQLVKLWKPHAAPLRGLEFSVDGAALVSAAVDGKILVSALDGQVIRWIDYPPGVASLARSPDGAILATGGYDGLIRLWRFADGSAIRTLGDTDGPVWTVAFSPDSRTLASAGEERAVRLWDVASGALRHRLTGHTLNIWTLGFSPDGTRLASGSFDSKVKLWDPAGARLVRDLADHQQAVVGLRWSPDGRLATGGDDDMVRIWDQDGRPLRAFAAGHHVHAIVFTPDNRWMAVGGAESGGINMLSRQIFSARVGGGNGVTVRVWRVADAAMVAALNPFADEVVPIAISPDGQFLAAGSDTGEVALWKLMQR
jgi:WD40 repeat protein